MTPRVRIRADKERETAFLQQMFLSIFGWREHKRLWTVSASIRAALLDLIYALSFLGFKSD